MRIYFQLYSFNLYIFIQKHQLHIFLFFSFQMAAFECIICAKKFTAKRNLTAHVKAVHEGIRNYACDLCNYKATTKQNIETHKLSHQSRRNFTCTEQIVQRRLHIKRIWSDIKRLIQYLWDQTLFLL